MNRFSIVLTVALVACLASPAAMAQTQPPQAAPPARPPALHKVQKPPARANSALGHSEPGKPLKRAARRTPVVRAPANAHAQKPAPAKPVAAARPAPAKPAAAPAAAPVVGKEVVKPAAPLPPAAAVESPKGSVTGLPLPRWVSLKVDEVNLRSGPGTRYPIEWVYHRVNLPVQIEREFEVWRLIEDQDGVKGWVHEATLTGRRTFVVKGKEQVLHRTASPTAAAVALLKPGVIGRIRSCDGKAEWCNVQVNDYRGFLRRADIYGIYPGEAVN